MTVTVNRINDDFWYEQDNDGKPAMSYLIRVPDRATFMPLVDCLHPDLELHALRLPHPDRADRSMPVSARQLVQIAEDKLWQDTSIAMIFI